MLRITVGAAMDRSFETTLNTLVAATAKAQRRIGQEEAKGHRERRRDAEATARAAETAAERATIRAEKAQRRAMNEAKRARREQTADAFRAADAQAKAAERAAARAVSASNHQKVAQVRNIRAWTQVGIQAINQQAQHLNAQTRLQNAMVRRASPAGTTRQRLASGIGSLGAIGAIGGALMGMGALNVAKWGVGQVVGAAGSLARGYGVETSMDTLMQGNTSHEALAAKIAGSGYRPNDPANSRMVGTRELMQEQFEVGKKHGFSGEDVAQAQDQIQKLTGDLSGARGVTERIAFYARATGTDLKEAGELFGKTMAAYDPKLDKGTRAQMAQDMMMSYAGQGKVGSVEIEDAAKIGGRLAGLAIRSGGDIVHGQKEAMAMLQFVNPLKGGDPRAGTTSVEAWYGQFGKDARKKGFKAFGLTDEERAANRRKGIKPGEGVEGVRTRDDFGNLRSQKDIIADLLTRSKGSKEAVESVVKDKNAQIFMSSVWKTFDQTAGTLEEKVAAVTNSFDELTNASLSEKEAIAMHGANMSTAQAKAQQFNTAMSQIVADMQSNLVPAMEALAPVVLSLADAFSRAIGQITGGLAKKIGEDQEGLTGGTNTATAELQAAIDKGQVTQPLLDRIGKDLLKYEGTFTKVSGEADALNRPGMAEKALRGVEGAAEGLPMLGAPIQGIAALGRKYLENTREGDAAKTAEGTTANEAAINNLRNKFNEASTKVTIVANEAERKPPPPHSPLGGHQAIAAGC